MQKFTILALLFLSVGLFAQKTSFEIGPEMDLPAGLKFWGQLYSGPDAHYVMLIKGGPADESPSGATPTLQKLDRSFHLLYSKSLPEFLDGQRFGNMFYAGGKFLLYSQEINKKEKNLRCLAAIVNLEGQVEKTQQLGSVAYKKSNFGPIDEQWAMSDDSTKLLAAVLAHGDPDHLRVKVSLNVYDRQLEKIWSQEIALPYNKEQLRQLAWTLGNDGQVYLLGKVYEEIKRTEWKLKGGIRSPAYEWVIFRFTAGRNNPQEFRLDLPGKFVTAETFKLDAKNNLNCTGFYADDNKGVLRGVFFTRFNGQSGAVDVATRKEFSPAELAGFDTQKDKSGDRGLDSKFKFNHLILRQDGGMLVMAEEAYDVFRYTPGMAGMPGTSTTYYINNEIFISSISAAGEIEWLRMIPKKQFYVNTSEFNGYMLMLGDTSMYFLYNDHKLNADKRLNTYAVVMDDPNTAIGAMVTVNYSGEMKRAKIFDTREDTDALMIPEYGRQIGPDELFFITRRPRFLKTSKFRMGVIRLE